MLDQTVCLRIDLKRNTWQSHLTEQMGQRETWRVLESYILLLAVWAQPSGSTILRNAAHYWAAMGAHHH